jgi:site-specific recombinase XerC
VQPPSQKSQSIRALYNLAHRWLLKATQLLNADADLATIQDLLVHSQITTTQRYCRVANLKVQRDYYKAIKVVLQRTQAQQEDDDEGESMEFNGDAE